MQKNFRVIVTPIVLILLSMLLGLEAQAQSQAEDVKPVYFVCFAYGTKTDTKGTVLKDEAGKEQLVIYVAPIFSLIKRQLPTAGEPASMEPQWKNWLLEQKKMHLIKDDKYTLSASCSPDSDRVNAVRYRQKNVIDQYGNKYSGGYEVIFVDYTGATVTPKAN